MDLSERYMKEHMEIRGNVREYFSHLMAPLSLEEKENILLAFQKLIGILESGEEESR